MRIASLSHFNKFILPFVPALAVLLFFGATSLSSAQAQSQPIFPPAAEVDRLQDLLGETNAFNRLETRSDPARPDLKQAFPSVPHNADAIFLELRSVAVEDVTAYDPSRFDSLWTDKVGSRISLGEIYRIANAITARYRADGYVLARAYLPAQEIADGSVKIAVSEGVVRGVRYEGTAPAGGFIQGAVSRLARLGPMNIHVLERQMLLLNDLPGYRFKVLLQNAAGDGDAAPTEGVTLVITSETAPPVQASIDINNNGSRYIGPFLATAGLSIDNAIARFNRTQLSITSTVPADELQFYAADHRIPLHYDGWWMGLHASHARGEPGFRLKDFDVENRSTTAGAEISWDAIRQRDRNLKITAGFDMRDSDTDILGERFTQDRLRIVSLSAHYDWQDRYSGVNLLDLTVSQGLGALLKGSHRNDIDLSRAEGDPSFTKLTASLYRNQALSDDWSLLLGLAGQIARSPLLSSEEFGYGGAAFGRAYDPSEIVGDHGAAFVAELRYRNIQLAPQMLLQPFVFYDFGMVWNKDDGQADRASGASTGFGMRLRARNNLSAGLSLAFPLTRSAGSPPSYSNEDGARMLFSLSSSF